MQQGQRKAARSETQGNGLQLVLGFPQPRRLQPQRNCKEESWLLLASGKLSSLQTRLTIGICRLI